MLGFLEDARNQFRKIKSQRVPRIRVLAWENDTGEKENIYLLDDAPSSPSRNLARGCLDRKRTWRVSNDAWRLAAANGDACASLGAS